MSEIGPIISGPHVEQAVVGVLEDFLPVYLADRAADAGKPRSTYQVQSIARSATVDTRFPDDKLPCVTIRALNKTSEYVDGEGGVTARFNVVIGAVLRDQSLEKASDVAWAYGAAIEAVLIQHGALDAFADAIEWNDTVPEDIELADRRTKAGVIVDIDVIVSDTVNRSMGPLEPPDDPTVPLPGDVAPLDVDIDVQPGDPGDD